VPLSQPCGVISAVHGRIRQGIRTCFSGPKVGHDLVHFSLWFAILVESYGYVFDGERTIILALRHCLNIYTNRHVTVSLY